LKKNLNDLLNKGYMKPSKSPWDAPMLLWKRRMGLQNVVSTFCHNIFLWKGCLLIGSPKVLMNSSCIPCLFTKKYVSNLFHVLLELLQTLNEVNTLAKLEQFFLIKVHNIKIECGMRCC
jgi:hypothetical protein